MLKKSIRVCPIFASSNTVGYNTVKTKLNQGTQLRIPNKNETVSHSIKLKNA